MPTLALTHAMFLCACISQHHNYEIMISHLTAVPNAVPTHCPCSAHIVPTQCPSQCFAAVLHVVPLSVLRCSAPRSAPLSASLQCST